MLVVAALARSLRTTRATCSTTMTFLGRSSSSWSPSKASVSVGWKKRTHQLELDPLASTTRWTASCWWIVIEGYLCSFLWLKPHRKATTRQQIEMQQVCTWGWKFGSWKQWGGRERQRQPRPCTAKWKAQCSDVRKRSSGAPKAALSNKNRTLHNGALEP